MLRSAFGTRPLHLQMGGRLSCWTFASKTRRRYAAFGIMALHGRGRSLPRNASIDSHAKRDLDTSSILLLVLGPVCSNHLGSRLETRKVAHRVALVVGASATKRTVSTRPCFNSKRAFYCCPRCLRECRRILDWKEPPHWVSKVAAVSSSWLWVLEGGGVWMTFGGALMALSAFRRISLWLAFGLPRIAAEFPMSVPETSDIGRVKWRRTFGGTLRVDRAARTFPERAPRDLRTPGCLARG